MELVTLKNKLTKDRYLKIRDRFKSAVSGGVPLPHEVFIVNALIMGKNPNVTTHDLSSESYKNNFESALYHLHWVNVEGDKVKGNARVYRDNVFFRGDFITMSNLLKEVFGLTKDEAATLI